MAVPKWPAGLPQTPLIQGYKETVPSTLLRSNTDTGPAKVRRRGHSKPYLVEAPYMLTTEQVNALIYFIEYQLEYGAKCFSWPRPRKFNVNSSESGLVRARINPDGDGLISYSAVADTTDLWMVTLKLEIFPDVPAN